MQDRGLTRALLGIEHRKSVTAGETHRYTIPVLRVPHTLDALAAGAARVGAIGSGPQAPALGAGSSEVTPQSEADESTLPPATQGHVTDDEVVDAEIVDDGTRSLADVLPEQLPEGVTPAKALTTARRLAPEFGIELPTALDQVTDYRLVARVLVELGCVEAVG